MRILRLKKFWLVSLVAIYLLVVLLKYQTNLFNLWDMPPTILPAETADAETLQQFFDWQAMPLLRKGKYVQQGSDERELKDYPLVFPIPDAYMPLRWTDNDDTLNFICQGANSKIDLTGFFEPHFDEAICAESYVKGAVMARFSGSGRFVRFWMTQASAVINLVDEEVFRVYVDDNPVPIIQVPLKDVFSGKAGEMFAVPFGAEEYTYVAWYYPIVFNKKFIISIDQLGPMDLYYHQTDVVLDDVPVNRKPAGEKLAERVTALNNINADDGHLSPSASALHEALAIQLGAGNAYEVSLPGPATIEEISITIDENQLDALRASQIGLQWDEQNVLAVDANMGDFFAMSFDAEQRLKGPITVVKETGQITFRFKLPMPYHARAFFVIKTWDKALTINAIKISGIKEAPTKDWGYFYAHVSTVKTPAFSPMHPVLDVKGRGRLAGVCAQLWGKKGEGYGEAVPYSFLEGDETILIDGELAVQGTGTEDYFNSSFYYFREPFDGIFAQVWGKEKAEKGQGERVSQCRWHIFGDAIDFQSDLNFELEVGGRAPAAVKDYRTTAYYYIEYLMLDTLN